MTRFDTALFSSVEDDQQYKQHFAQRQLVLGRNINFPQLQHFGFKDIFTRMGWLPMVTISEPVFSILVQDFYSRVTYGLGGLSFLLSDESRSVWTRRASAAFSILLWLDSKCTSPRFGPLYQDLSLERSFRGFVAFQMPRGWANPRPTAWPSLVGCYTTWCFIFLPRGGHWNEVFYYEAFLIYSVLTRKQIHLGYLMMMHMISGCESTTLILPYGRLFTRVFKDVGIDLSREIDFEASNAYDTYDD